jgi:hypothetical protein
MPAFIAYYRVSTDRQGASGLGLQAQRTAVLRHIAAGQLAAEYTEVESGKKHTNRPQLLAALQEMPQAQGNPRNSEARQARAQRSFYFRADGEWRGVRMLRQSPRQPAYAAHAGRVRGA